MKNNRKIVSFGVVALAVIIVACACVGVALGLKNNNAFAAEVVVDIKDGYSVGETLDIPQTATVSFEGNDYPATFYILMLPDGSGTKSASIKLDAVGKHTAIYQFVVDNKTLQAEKTFNVSKSSWLSDTGESTISYGELAVRPGVSGLNLTLARGDTFTYSKPITLTDDGPTEIISFFPEQFQKTVPFTGDVATAGNYDAQRLIVRLTDCYNPEIYIDFVFFFDTNPSNGVNVRTRCTGQGEYGLVSNQQAISTHNLPEVYIDGMRYGYWQGQWGGSFFSNGASKETNQMMWSYDKNTNRVYVGSAVDEKEQFQALVNILDNKDISANVFPGFTTDQVYVSVTAADFSGNFTKFQISSIGNFSGEDLASETYVDTIAPTVKPDTTGVTGEIFAQVGKPFPLFDANAFDDNLLGSISAKVFYNYGTPMQSAVLVRDGSFVPAQEGAYTIEYNARDSFGNVGKATVSVTVVKQVVTTFTTQNITSAMAGVAQVLPEYATSSLNGDVKVVIKSISADGTVTEINAKDRLFTPISVGEHTLVFTYSDMIRSYEYSYTVDVQANPNYGFIEMPNLQNVYLKGVIYQIDDIKAYSFKGATPVPQDTVAYVRFDGGEYQQVSNLTSVDITGNTSVQFKYVAGESFYETPVRPIKDVGYNNELHIEKYFDGNFQNNPTSNYIDFTSNATTGSNQLDFAMPVATNLFSIKYALPNVGKLFETFDIVLTDSDDNKVVLSHQNVGGKLAIAVNGGNPVTVSGTLNDGEEKTITYDPANKQFLVSDKNATTAIIFEMQLGEFANLSFVFNGLSGNATVRLINIMNQLICNDTGDYFTPQLFVTKAKGYVEVNSQITVYPATVVDVLSPIAAKDFTVSVKAPDGTFAKDVNGLELKNVSAKGQYDVVLSQFGSYRVEYNAVDAYGQRARSVYIVTSADVTAPTISFVDGSTADTVQTMKVGYKYKLKEFIVSDNDTPADQIESHIFIYNQNGQLILADRMDFTPTFADMYTVYVYCLDSAGNSSFITYQIKVVDAD